MKSYPNIEKSAFSNRQYVGYAPISGVWHIKGKTGAWWAWCQTGRDKLGCVSTRTLQEMSDKLRVR